MLRRLYYLFPEPAQAARAVEDLELAMGIRRRRMHALAKPGVDLGGLPEANGRQRSDFVARLEQLFWNANLRVFFIALAAVFLGVVFGYWGIAVLAAAMAVCCFLVGDHFAAHIPHAHLEEFRAALGHGEVLLMVDVPKWKVHEVDDVISRRHPEAGLGGVGWTIEALHT